MKLNRYVRSGIISVIVGIILTLILIPFGTDFGLYKFPFILAGLPLMSLIVVIFPNSLDPLLDILRITIIDPFGILSFFIIGLLIAYIKKLFKQKKYIWGIGVCILIILAFFVSFRG